MLILTPCNSQHDSDDDLMYRATLAQVCGEDFETTTCCTLGQLETLQSSLAQAEPLIASCTSSSSFPLPSCLSR